MWRGTASRSLFDLILVFAFCSSIAAPGVWHLFTEDDWQSVADEHREPTLFPARPTSVAELADWIKSFESYFDDAFRAREPLIRWHSLFKLVGLETAPGPAVVRGEDGWLFFTGNGLIDRHRGLARLEEPALAEMVASLEERAAWLDARGIRYLVVIGPDKHGIYPEQLPDWCQSIGSSTPMDQLVAASTLGGHARILDLREPLRAAKDEGLLYYPHGTHWNELGAWVAYREIAAACGEWFPKIVPEPLDAFTLEESYGTADSWAIRYHVADIIRQRQVKLRRIAAPVWRQVSTWVLGPQDRVTAVEDPELPRGLILHDSFAQAVRPFLAQHFSRMTWVWDLRFNRELIETLQPDLVIQLVVERNIGRGLFNPPAGRNVAAGAGAGGEADRLPPDRLVGRYYNPVFGDLDVTLDASILQAEARGNRLRLESVMGDIYEGGVDPDPKTRFVFTPDRDGEVQQLTVIDRRLPDPMIYLPSGDRAGSGAAARWSDLTGTYARQLQRFHVIENAGRLVCFDREGRLMGQLVGLGGGRFEVRGSVDYKVTITPPTRDSPGQFILETSRGRFVAPRVEGR